MPLRASRRDNTAWKQYALIIRQEKNVCFTVCHAMVSRCFTHMIPDGSLRIPVVREKLWETVKQKSEGGNCLLAYSTNNEQGFTMETYGNLRRSIIDFDGLQLIKIQS